MYLSTADQESINPVDRDLQVANVISRITAAELDQLDERVGAIVEHLVTEIESFATDQPILDQLNAGATHNFSITMAILRHDIEIEQVGPSEPAIELARLMAEQDIPITDLEHAYRLYQETVVRWCLQGLSVRSRNAAVTAQAALEISALVSAHMNLIAQQLLTTYESARDAWRLRRTATRSARIKDVLAGRAIDLAPTEEILGYHFDQYHLGIIMWTDDTEGTPSAIAHFEAAASTFTDRLGINGHPLLEARDAHMARAWIPLGRRNGLDHTRLDAMRGSWTGPVVVTVGNARHGLDGFVRTHAEADSARAVLQASEASGFGVVCAKELGAVTLLCSDLSSTRAWVAETLGPLASDSAALAQLRSTLREFFRTGCSYAATAESLHMHKNSVVYRIRKIEEQLGRSVREHRLDLENALELAFWLGSAVLRQA
ncbi:helix-turn-helix domain-containing protein [Nocardia callitridis]|uniref:Helix-turn-helix domain-containing protein n=2 Tax=Nocardia callitridis TaxID=648753 RepID=A0ABP9KL40_9NOCA